MGRRNFCHFGHWKLTTTHGGYTLLLANNPGFYRYLAEAPWGAVWTSEALDAAWQYRHLAPDPGDIRWNNLASLPTSSPHAAKGGLEDEFADDRLAYALALRFAREQPLLFAYSCLVRIGRLWGVMPHAGLEQETTAKRTLPTQSQSGTPPCLRSPCGDWSPAVGRCFVGRGSAAYSCV